MSAGDALLDVAREAAREAARLLAGARAADVRHKGNPRDLVTEWDLRSEELIRRVLSERAPGIAILGEEGGQTAPSARATDGSAHAVEPTGGRERWLVDPIDGTVNFAHGFPIWSISIALEDADGVRCGVVYAPALGWWFEAARGAGAVARAGFDGTAADAAATSLRVSAVPALDLALLTTGFPYDRATNPENNFAQWEHMQRTAGACRRLGCASIDLCLVARGWLDGYWERRLSPWDLAAGALIVAEAGGTVTNTRGGRFDPHEGEVVASNGAIHSGLLAELERSRS